MPWLKKIRIVWEVVKRACPGWQGVLFYTVQPTQEIVVKE